MNWLWKFVTSYEVFMVDIISIQMICLSMPTDKCLFEAEKMLVMMNKVTDLELLPSLQHFLSLQQRFVASDEPF